MTQLDLEQRIAAVLPDVVSFRHELHEIPEIAGKEEKTSALIRQRLAPLGLELQAPFLKTDVVAMLNAGKKRNLTLRADIDGLPLEELDQELPYRSQHPGRMHACGHDGHAAMLYGAARVLAGLREQVPCSVRFLFQPGEEATCMARDVLASGALRDPEPDFITGLHSWPNEPYGKINSKPGVLMAAAGFFRITLQGRGGHGSMPQLANNPIDCAADIMVACRKVVPKGCVLSFCSCRAGSNDNVIPEQLEMQGTIRFLERETGERFLADFQRTVTEIAEGRGVFCDFHCPLNYLPLVNQPDDYECVRGILVRNCGEDAFGELPVHTMSSEDFSWYLQKYRGVFCHIGSGESTPLHSPKFNFNDELLGVGIRYFCTLALHAEELW